MILVSKLMKPISYEKFLEIVKTPIKNIDHAFSNYSSGILDTQDHCLSLKEAKELNVGQVCSYNISHEDKYVNFMNAVYELNKNKPIVVDFYLKEIDNDGCLKILQHLDHEDKIIFIDHLRNLNTETVYFLLEHEELVSFVTKLSTRELHFCTIYFNEIPMAIWGNYELSFPIFFSNPKEVEVYSDLAHKNNLFIRDVILK